MKILLFPLEGNKTPSDAFLGNERPFVHTLPDTVLLGTKRPFFIPDFAPVCKAHLHMALRICRLGRSISRRFAHRYYDALAPVVHFTAHPLLEQLRSEGRPWDMACGFDGALSVGPFVSLPIISADSYVLHQNGAPAALLSLSPSLALVDAWIEQVSQFYTLRQGDLLVFGSPTASPEVHIDDRLAVQVGEDEVLAFNVK